MIFFNRPLKKLKSSLKLAPRVASILFGKKRAPLYMGLFITERCNLKCVYCFPDSPHREDRDPPLNKIFRIIDELYSLGTRYITILGGEPLLRKDFGKIVNYIVSKGILAEVGTNGYFTKARIRDLKKLHLVCHSIDGDEKEHDLNRGNGSFKKIIESILLCRNHGIPIQLRAVFNRNNVNSLGFLLKLSKDLGTSLALSEQAVVRERDKKFAFSPQEAKTFWEAVRAYKTQGYRIDKNLELLENIINYPIDLPYEKIVERDESAQFSGNIPQCGLSNGYGFLDVNGFLYPCANLFGKFGKNINVVGIRTAWEFLNNKPCCFCRQSVQDLKSYFFSGDYSSTKIALTNFLSK